MQIQQNLVMFPRSSSFIITQTIREQLDTCLSFKLSAQFSFHWLSWSGNQLLITWSYVYMLKELSLHWETINASQMFSPLTCILVIIMRSQQSVKISCGLKYIRERLICCAIHSQGLCRFHDPWQLFLQAWHSTALQLNEKILPLTNCKSNYQN